MARFGLRAASGRDGGVFRSLGAALPSGDFAAALSSSFLFSFLR